MTEGALTGAARARAGLYARTTRRLTLEVARRIRVGELSVALGDGTRQTFKGQTAGPRAEIHIQDPSALWQIILGGEIAAGRTYMDGGWSSPDLPALLRVAALNREALALSGGPLRAPLQLPRTLAHRARRNTLRGARQNIESHYDLGNDFYRLFLDDTMTYSSAVFATPNQSLAEAQRNKYRIIAERAGVGPGMHVLEIGSGWGGFALYAAGELGARVTTITISPSQHELATERIRAAGLADLASVELRDYREIQGTYDAVVSIEMLEAVGAEYFGAFFGAVDRALKPGGKASIQSICFPDTDYEPQRRSANWIQTYIFPGGLLPSVAEIERALHGTRLLLTGTQDIAEHYVRTLATWRATFMARLDEVRAMGFDDRFIRMWGYYLALSEAGFATGLVQDQQFVLEKKRGVAL